MDRHLRPALAFAMLAAAILACASPLEGGREGPSSSDQVETAVAMTLQALTPVSEEVTPAPPAGLLPHSLYFVNNLRTQSPA